jgi:large subunit ribosomal protein L23
VHEEQFRPGYRERPARDRKSIAEQAKALLEGKETWRSTPQGLQWQDIGEAEEVETHVDVGKATRE